MTPPSDPPRGDARTPQDQPTPDEAPEHRLDETITSTPSPESAAVPIALPLADPGRFQLEDEIGRGGVGRVVRAVDRPLGRAVAIKQILTDAPQLDARFYREMRLTARLQHPAIVPLYDAGRWPDGQPFYAMKLVEGRSLKDVFNGCASLAERMALLPKLLTVCEAVAYAHAQGVLHRDLKPANVLIGPFGETMVIDWGVAKDLRSPEEAAAPSRTTPVGDDTLTSVGTVIGTPAYMPPEQARGEEVDERADVYALGAMLYELLSGLRPYKGVSSSVEVLKAVIARPPQSVREVAPDAPPELLAIVEAAMARDRSARYPTAAAMAEDLRRFETGQLVAAHRYPIRTLVRRWVARHRGVVQAALLFVLGGAIAGALSIRRVVLARDAAQKAQASAERALVVARDRQDQLILTQARTALATDPTATLAWLKQLPADTRRLDSARELATSAYLRGYAQHSWRGPDSVTSVAYSRDGRYVAAAFPGAILIADARTGHAVQKATTTDLDQIRYAPEGSSLSPDVLLAPGPRGALWLLGPDGQVTNTLQGHTGSVLAMDWSADGKTLVTGGADREVRVWDLTRRESRLIGKHVGVVERVVVATDGKHVASASGGELIIWDLATGRARKIMATRHHTGLGRLYEAAGEYSRIAFSPDGRVVAAVLSSSNDVELWPVAGGGPDRLTFPETLSSLRYTPSGSLLVGGESGKVYHWVRGHQWHILLEVAKDQIEDIALARRPDSPMPLIIGAASRDQIIALVRPLEDDRFELHGHAAKVRTVQFSPDGTHLLSGSADGTVRLWYLRPQYDQTLFTDGSSHAAAVSPDGKLIAFGTDGAVELQKIVANSREAEEKSIHVGAGPVAAVVWTPDGKSVAAAKDGGVYLVGLDGSTRLLAKSRTLVARLTFVDGGRKLVGDDEDGAVWLWELSSGRAWALATAGAAAGPTAVAVDGDAIAIPQQGRTLVFSARDPARAPLVVSDGTEQVVAALSATGDWLATGTAKGGVALWELPSRKRRVLLDEDGGAAVLALGLSRDGRLALLSASRDLKYVDLASGRIEVAPHNEVMVRGALLSASLDHAVAWAGPDFWVWDRASFTWRSLPGWSDVRGVALSPDGNRAIVTNDGNSAERVELGRSPVPRDATGLGTWLDAATSTVIQANRPTTPR